MKNTRKYDFSGWVTKNDIQCNDGLIIKRNAFSKNHKTKVPLVWNHRRDDPENIIGTIELENKDKGVYGYGTFIDTPKAAYAKSAVNQKAIVAMSIAASNIERNGNDIIGGDIFEVSLVTKGANPGAFIDEVISHSIDEEDYSCIYLPYEIETYIEHSSKEEKMEEKLTEEQEAKNTETEEKQLDPSKLTEEDIDRIIDSLNDEQAMLFNLLAMDHEKISKDSEGEGEEVKQNIFSSDNVLEHGVDTNEILDVFKKGKVTRLTDAVIEHGIESVDLLFTNSKVLDEVPVQSYPELETADNVLKSVTKSPFSRIKNRYLSNLGIDELVTKGYIRGDEKQPYNIKKIMSRETTPKTIYIKQHMDRDDILDIKDFDVVRFIKQDMETRFKIDLARFILVGDNRKDEDPDKVDEDKLRPILNDSDVYVSKYDLNSSKTSGKDLVYELQVKVLDFFSKYKGAGKPTLYINKKDFNVLRLVRFNNQGFEHFVLSGNHKLPKESDLADFLEIGDVVVTDLVPEGYSILVNLADYQLGNDTGSDKVNFENFDIDRNQYKYLLETRLSGALVTPDSAAVFKLYSEASKPNKNEPTREKNNIKPASQYVNS